MNCILFLPEELTGTTVRVHGERAALLFDQHQLVAGTCVRAGIIGGPLGEFNAERSDTSEISGVFQASGNPPKKLPITLLVAVPRPQAIKKVCHFAANSGVGRVIFFRGENTSKSYLQSKSLRPELIERQVLLGLQQAIDTVLPDIQVLQSLSEGVRTFSAPHDIGFYGDVAAPLSATLSKVLSDGEYPSTPQFHTWFVVGPELGLSERELEELQRVGFKEVSLGERVLRVETAVTKAVFLLENYIQSSAKEAIT